jgi:hypothetical protein
MGWQVETGFLGFLAFFVLIIIWIALFLIWAFSIWDIFRRRDLGGLAKAGYFLLIIILPLIGTVVYLILRPRSVDAEVTALPEGATNMSSAAQLETLAKLKEAGHLTEEEFAAQKAKLS